MRELKELVFRLCKAGGTPGDESAAAAAAAREFQDVLKRTQMRWGICWLLWGIQNQKITFCWMHTWIKSGWL